MIRYINCFRKKSGVSAEEFRECWNSTEYNELIERIAAFYQAVRYAKNLTLRVEMGQKLISDRGMSEPYDGIIEYYWDNAHQLSTLYETPEARILGEKIGKYQNEFIDLSRSTAFFTEDDS
ncbi:MAG: EthD domain-containing protein [Thiogranum sp.]